MEEQKLKLIKRCKEYLESFPKAKKIVFIAKDSYSAETEIKSYISLLIEHYGLSQTAKYKRNNILDSELNIKAIELIELCKSSINLIELETKNLIDKESVYKSFIENMNFYRKHNLNYESFKKNIEDYVNEFCNEELAHRIIGNDVQKWLNDEAYSEELINKFKEYDFSLSYNLKKIMKAKLARLNETEKNFLKDKCLDEIMLDQIFSSLFMSGYLNGSETKQMFSKHIKETRYWYSIISSLA